jgi:hypothetical protein
VQKVGELTAAMRAHERPQPQPHPALLAQAQVAWEALAVIGSSTTPDNNKTPQKVSSLPTAAFSQPEGGNSQVFLSQRCARDLSQRCARDVSRIGVMLASTVPLRTHWVKVHIHMCTSQALSESPYMDSGTRLPSPARHTAAGERPMQAQQNRQDVKQSGPNPNPEPQTSQTPPETQT